MATHDAMLDGNQIQFESTSFTEDDAAQISDYDVWEDDAFKRDLHVWRKNRAWTLKCTEQNVDWNDSAAKKLGTAMLNGGAASDGVLAFGMDKGVLHQIGSVNVYLKQVNVTYESESIRHFTLALQKKED